jgi:hypothetical protein
VEFMELLQEEIRKSVKFYCEQIVRFDEQVGLAYHCIQELVAINALKNKKERKKRMEKVIYFRGTYVHSSYS